MAEGPLHFIVKSGKERMRDMCHVQFPQMPVVGNYMAEIIGPLNVKRKYVIKEVTTYLYPSGKDLVLDNSSNRPFGEIVIMEVNIAEEDKKNLNDKKSVAEEDKNKRLDAVLDGKGV
jgi:hypothetical protein